MSRRHSSAPRAQVISQVMIDTASLTPNALKYPHGFVTNCRVENVPLMEQAAGQIGVGLKVGSAKFENLARTKNRTGYVGIYLDAVDRAPDLLHAFQQLQIAAFVEKRNKEEPDVSRN